MVVKLALATGSGNKLIRNGGMIMQRIIKKVTLIFAVAVLVVLSVGTSASAKKIKIKKPAITVKKKASCSSLPKTRS